MASLLPGVFYLVNAVTGSGPVLWRLVFLAPVAPLTGLLIATAVSRRHRLRSAVLPVGLVLVLLWQGTPVWSRDVGAELTARPVWKVDQVATPVARQIASIPVPDGPVLLPSAEMRMLPLITTQTFSLVPRDLYAVGLSESTATKKARFALYNFVSGPSALRTSAQVEHALDQLNVSLVCLDSGRRQKLRLVRSAGYERRARVGHLVCLVRRD